MTVNGKDAVATADRMVSRYQTRDPRRLAEELGIMIMPQPFVRQKGAYKVMYRTSKKGQ